MSPSQKLIAEIYAIVEDSCRQDNPLGPVCRAVNVGTQKGRIANREEVTLISLYGHFKQGRRENKDRISKRVQQARHWTSDENIATRDIKHLPAILDYELFGTKFDKDEPSGPTGQISDIPNGKDFDKANYIVMELAVPTTPQILNEQLGQDPTKAIRFIQQLADELATIHCTDVGDQSNGTASQTIWRPPIKIENLLVRPIVQGTDSLLLSDWGFGASNGRAPSRSMTPEINEHEDVVALATMLRHIWAEFYEPIDSSLTDRIADAEQAKTLDDFSKKLCAIKSDFREQSKPKEQGNAEDNSTSIKEPNDLSNAKLLSSNATAKDAPKLLSAFVPVSREKSQTRGRTSADNRPVYLNDRLIIENLRFGERGKQPLDVSARFDDKSQQAELFQIGSNVEAFRDKEKSRLTDLENGLAPRQLYVERRQSRDDKDYYDYVLFGIDQYMQNQSVTVDGTPISALHAVLLREEEDVEVDGTYRITLKRDPTHPAREWAAVTKRSIAALKLKGSNVFVPDSGEQFIDIPLQITNPTTLSERMTIVADGAPVDWIATPVQLRSDREDVDKPQDTEFILELPSVPLAGEYEITLRLLSSNLDAQVAAQQIRVIIKPVHDLRGTLVPQTVQVQRRGELHITNHGNVAEEFQVNWFDQDGALRFEPPDVRVQLRPRHTGVVSYRALNQRWRLIGRTANHPMTVTVTRRPSGEPQPYLGQVVSRALIPAWAPWLFALLFIGALLLYSFLFPPDFVERTITDANNVIMGSSPVAGQDAQLDWRANNACFYAVYENGVLTRSLRPHWSRTSYTVENGNVDDEIEVRLRNCTLVQSNSWRTKVIAAPLPPPIAPEPPHAQLSITSRNVELVPIGLGGPVSARTAQSDPPRFLIGQTGDLCIRWAAENEYDQTVYRLKIGVEPSLPLFDALSAIEEREGERCFKIADSFEVPGTYIVTLLALNQSSQTEPQLRLHQQTIELVQPQCVVNTGVSLNLREGPGRNYPVRGEIRPQEKVYPLFAPLKPREQALGEQEFWVQATFADDPRPVWMAYTYLHCQYDIGVLPLPNEIPVTPSPTPTETPVPTATPEPTETPVPIVEPELSVEPEIINVGGCAKLKWTVKNVSAVYLDGEGVVGESEAQVCPSVPDTYEYVLRIVAKDESVSEKKVTLIVNP